MYWHGVHESNMKLGLTLEINLLFETGRKRTSFFGGALRIVLSVLLSGSFK